MTAVIWLALILLIAGLIACYLSGSVKYPALVNVVFWAGIVLVVVGLVLLLTPVLIYLNGVLRGMMGV